MIDLLRESGFRSSSCLIGLLQMPRIPFEAWNGRGSLSGRLKLTPLGRARIGLGQESRTS